MKFGFRTPSLTKRIAARTSVKRMVRNSMGLKVPRGWGIVTNPQKAVYNKIYNKTSRGCLVILLMMASVFFSILAFIFFVRF